MKLSCVDVEIVVLYADEYIEYIFHITTEKDSKSPDDKEPQVQE